MPILLSHSLAVLFLSFQASLTTISFAPQWFLQGIFHPLQTPSHILLLLGLGLLIGQQQHIVKHQVRSWLVFCLALITGLILNQFINLDININVELMLLALGLVVSLFVIIKMVLPDWFVFLLAVITGLALGCDSSPVLIPGLGVVSIYNWLAGAASSFMGVIMITTLLASFANKPWQGIILRVLASWIATSAIFVLTFMLLKF